MTQYDLSKIQTALVEELQEMRDRDISRFPEEADMEAMFQGDYQDGCQVAELIGQGLFAEANCSMSGMDTAARESVAEAIVRVNRQFFVDHIMGEEWKHPDQWC